MPVAGPRQRAGKPIPTPQHPIAGTDNKTWTNNKGEEYGYNVKAEATVQVTTQRTETKSWPFNNPATTFEGGQLLLREENHL